MDFKFLEELDSYLYQFLFMEIHNQTLINSLIKNKKKLTKIQKHFYGVMDITNLVPIKF